MRLLGLKSAIKARQARGLDHDELGPLQSHQDAKRWLEVVGRAVASGKLGERAAQAVIRAVSEWVRAEGQRFTVTAVEKLREEVERIRQSLAGVGPSRG